ncbi:MAG: phosphatase PAP2 family protein [Candidatus Kapaibacteriota bacterium]
MLESIVYGNPPRDILPYLEKESFLDKHFASLSKFSFPINTSKATREELNILVDCMNDLEKRPEMLNRYLSYDHELERSFAKLCMDMKLSEEIINVVDSLFDDINPLIAKLKMHFQRARPYQLAYAYKIKLFPYSSYTSNTPSYPSGHALQSKVICYVLGNYIPEQFAYFESLANDICYSRQYLGLHYQSDIDFAILCFEQIIKDKEFKAKYKI